ncbi:MAG: hypothetical protein ACYDDF_15000 [Thermoplasmatota archaeon]
MGFSVSASVAIIALGLVSVAGVALDAAFGAWSNANAAERDAWSVRDSASRTNVTITAVAWNGSTHSLSIRATNSGVSVLDASKAIFLVSGVWASNSVTNQTVENRSSSVWNPGETLAATLTNATWTTQPQSIELATEYGVRAYWRMTG